MTPRITGTHQWLGLVVAVGAGGLSLAVGRIVPSLAGVALIILTDVTVGALFQQVHAGKLALGLLLVPLLSGGLLAPSNWHNAFWAVPIAFLVSVTLVQIGKTVQCPIACGRHDG